MIKYLNQSFCANMNLIKWLQNKMMTNELTYKYLNKLQRVSLSIFFLQLFTIISALLLPLSLLLLSSSNVFLNSDIFIPDWIYITLISFFSILLFILIFTNFALVIVAITFSFRINIDQEPITSLMVLSILSFFFLIVSPFIHWVLTIKYANKIEYLSVKRNRKDQEEVYDDNK